MPTEKNSNFHWNLIPKLYYVWIENTVCLKKLCYELIINRLYVTTVAISECKKYICAVI